jgi:hypothetical protein
MISGKVTGNFIDSGTLVPIPTLDIHANSGACGKIPYALEQGILSVYQG